MIKILILLLLIFSSVYCLDWIKNRKKVIILQ